MALSKRFCEVFGVRNQAHLEEICGMKRSGLRNNNPEYLSYMKRWAKMAIPPQIMLMPSTCGTRILTGLGGSNHTIEDEIIGGIAAMLIGDDTRRADYTDSGQVKIGVKWQEPGKVGNSFTGQWHRNMVYYGSRPDIIKELQEFGFEAKVVFNNPTGVDNLHMMVLTL